MSKVRFTYSIEDFLFSRLTDISEELGINRNQILDALLYEGLRDSNSVVYALQDFEKYKAYRKYMVLDGREPEPYLG